MDFHFYVDSYPSMPKSGNYFFMESRYWDDFTFKTEFKIDFISNGTRIELGFVKILHSDEKVTKDVIPKNFKELSADFCSLGQDIEYYSNLKENFPKDYNKILEALNDIAFFDGIKDRFEHHHGFRDSLIRYSEALKAYQEAKPRIENIPFEIEPNFQFTYNCFLPNAEERHQVTFNFGDNLSLPNNIVAIIGKNGTGKTQFLARLALDLSGKSQSKLKVDSFDSERPPFSKVIAISYSAFDKFQIPVPDKSFSYYYAGIRDRNGGIMSSNKIYEKLKDSSERINQLSRQSFLRLQLENYFDHPTFKIIDENLFSLKEVSLKDNFNDELSSGQNFVVYVVTEIIANIKKNSLLLIDEPEMHQHPNAIAKFIRLLNSILEKYESFAIISTHSPVILQEIPSRYVKVFDRIGNIPLVHDLSIESFGENIDTLTEEIFQTRDIRGNYKEVLEKLSENFEYDEIMNLFDQNLGLKPSSFLLNLYRNSDKS